MIVWIDAFGKHDVVYWNTHFHWFGKCVEISMCLN